MPQRLGAPGGVQGPRERDGLVEGLVLLSPQRARQPQEQLLLRRLGGSSSLRHGRASTSWHPINHISDRCFSRFDKKAKLAISFRSLLEMVIQEK